jgi:glycine/D-amino acid oxidase-like deaminating enzyme
MEHILYLLSSFSIINYIKDAPSLEADTTADVAVVGAGKAGLSIAYE